MSKALVQAFNASFRQIVTDMAGRYDFDAKTAIESLEFVMPKSRETELRQSNKALREENDRLKAQVLALQERGAAADGACERPAPPAVWRHALAGSGG